MSESIESLLLTPKENKLVVQTLGKGRKSLATGVAQVYLALPSNRTQWTKIGTGVVCLVKDKQEKSFFIRMLDIKEKTVVWEQELYKQFKYRAVSKYFQTFFAHDCRAGINFSNAEEAALFRAAIMERVNVFKKKRDEMRQKKMAAYQQQQQQQQMSFQMSQMAMQNPFFRMPYAVPQNLDYRMQSMLFMQMRAPSVAASQRAQLQAMFNSMPPETKQAFLASLNRGPSAMMGYPNMSGMQLANQSQSNMFVPPTPSQMQSPTKDGAQMPLPVPPAETQTRTSDIKVEDLEEPQGTQGTPPPPPGPPLPSAPPPPPPPTFAPPPPPALKSPTSGSPEPGGSATSPGDRGGLLESIQAGAKLRKVGEGQSQRKIPKVESGLRGALGRALDSRAKVMGDEESDEDEEWDDDDDDDWSD